MPSHDDDKILREIREELRHLRHDQHELKKLIMTYAESLKAFIAKQTQFNTAFTTGLDSASTSLEGLTADVKNLTDQIAVLQASVGEVTPEDQATIDAADSAATALQTKLEAFRDAIEALNALTPPVAPTA